MGSAQPLRAFFLPLPIPLPENKGASGEDTGTQYRQNLYYDEDSQILRDLRNIVEKLNADLMSFSPALHCPENYFLQHLYYLVSLFSIF